MHKSSVILFRWVIKYGVWLLFGIATYTVFAVEFSGLRVISLPFNSDAVDKLNDIGKNFSLSYIAGVVFYTLSEVIPFRRRKRYVKGKAIILADRLLKGINEFFDAFCGGHDMSDMSQLYYDAMQREYVASDNCKIKLDQLLAVRRLLALLEDTLGVLLQQNDYLDEDDQRKLLNVKTEDFYSLLIHLSQASVEVQKSGKEILILLQGVAYTYERLSELQVLKDYAG